MVVTHHADLLGLLEHVVQPLSGAVQHDVGLSRVLDLLQQRPATTNKHVATIPVLCGPLLVAPLLSPPSRGRPNICPAAASAWTASRWGVCPPPGAEPKPAYLYQQTAAASPGSPQCHCRLGRAPVNRRIGHPLRGRAHSVAFGLPARRFQADGAVIRLPPEGNDRTGEGQLISERSSPFFVRVATVYLSSLQRLNSSHGGK